jgi:hypothetical protein
VKGQRWQVRQNFRGSKLIEEIDRQNPGKEDEIVERQRKRQEEREDIVGGVRRRREEEEEEEQKRQLRQREREEVEAMQQIWTWQNILSNALRTEHHDRRCDRRCD